jgi:hypothetical protein
VTALRIEKFMGMAPKISNRLLPDSAGSSAKNVRLLSGELRGIRAPKVLHTFPDPGGGNRIKSAFHAFKNDGTEVWKGFTKADVDVARAPLVNDSYLRYYWTGDQAFVAYLPLASIESGAAPFRLGLPGPTTGPTVAPSGGTGDIETRAYVYTFVDTYGCESAPSPVTAADGAVDGTWALSGLATAGTDTTNRCTILYKNIYRTITGESSVEYYFVAQIALATATYSDTIASEVVVTHSTAESWSWTPPPDALLGLIAHPAGFLCGFVGRDLYFSEPYRPHAWPAAYVLSLEHDVVGLAIYNNMLCALTKSKPYFIAGSSPGSLAPIKSPSVETCLSKASIAATIQGVLYASPNGVVLFNESGAQVMSQSILTNEEWTRYSPATLRAAQWGMAYVGFYTTERGLKFNPAEPLALFSEIDHFSGVDNILTDWLTGFVWMIKDNIVYQWEPADGDHLEYTWYSKEFDFTRPVNLGAAMVKYTSFIPTPTEDLQTAITAYNTARMAAAPLNPFNFVAFNGTRNISLGSTPPLDPRTGLPFVQNKYPYGGSPLLSATGTAVAAPTVLLTVIADGVIRFQEQVQPNTMRRLPSGYKAHVWQFGMVASSDVYSLAVSETGKELESV